MKMEDSYLSSSSKGSFDETSQIKNSTTDLLTLNRIRDDKVKVCIIDEDNLIWKGDSDRTNKKQVQDAMETIDSVDKAICVEKKIMKVSRLNLFPKDLNQ